MSERGFRKFELESWDDGLSSELTNTFQEKTTELLANNGSLEHLTRVAHILEPLSLRTSDADDHRYSEAFVRGATTGIAIGRYMVNDDRKLDNLQASIYYPGKLYDQEDKLTAAEKRAFQKLVFTVSKNTIKKIPEFEEFLDGPSMAVLEPNEDFRGVARAAVGYGLYTVLQHVGVEYQPDALTEDEIANLDLDELISKLLSSDK